MSDKCILMARISSEEQESGFSLEAQENLLLDYAQEKEFKIAKRFIFTESAKESDKRKIFKDILDYLETHNDCHLWLVEKTDRISRNFEDYILVDKWLKKDDQNKVIFVKQNLTVHKNSLAHEKFMWGIHTLLANNTINNSSDEIKKGMRQKAENGCFPGKAPLGYINRQTIISSDIVLRTIDIDPVRLPLIEKAFKYYASGNYTLTTLAEKMYQEGLTTKAGRKLSKTIMDEVLKDDFYIGWFDWNKKKYKGTHPHAVSRELFDLVQIQLGSRTAGKLRKHAFTYKGLIRCVCGYAATGTIEKKYIYYGCSHYKPCNQKKYINEEKVNEQVGALLDSLKMPDDILEILKEQLKSEHTSEMSIQNKVLEDLKRRLTVLKNRLDILYNDKLDGIINLETYQEKQKQISEQIEEITGQIEKYNNKSIDYAQTGSIILELASHAKDIFLHRTSDEKRLLLSFVISKIVLRDGNLEFQLKKPFDIILNGFKSKDWCPHQDSNLEPSA